MSTLTWALRAFTITYFCERLHGHSANKACAARSVLTCACNPSHPVLQQLSDGMRGSPSGFRAPKLAAKPPWRTLGQQHAREQVVSRSMDSARAHGSGSGAARTLTASKCCASAREGCELSLKFTLCTQAPNCSVSASAHALDGRAWELHHRPLTELRVHHRRT